MTGVSLTRRTALAGLTVLLGGLAGTARAAPAEHEVILGKMKFGPAPAPLLVGDVIVWVNKDPVRHTATARDGSFDIDLPPGKEGRLIVAAAGEVEVFCRFHPGMKLKLMVGSA